VAQRSECSEVRPVTDMVAYDGATVRINTSVAYTEQQPL